MMSRRKCGKNKKEPLTTQSIPPTTGDFIMVWATTNGGMKRYYIIQQHNDLKPTAKATKELFRIKRWNFLDLPKGQTEREKSPQEAIAKIAIPV